MTNQAKLPLFDMQAALNGLREGNGLTGKDGKVAMNATKQLVRTVLVMVAGLFCTTSLPVLAADATAAAGTTKADTPSCLALNQLGASSTPADLYMRYPTCIKQKAYKKALAVWTLATLYARYDAARVADPSASAVIPVLRHAATGLLSKSQKDAASAAIASLTKDSAYHAYLCRDIGAIGPPGYFPSYMVRHGLAAFDGKLGSDALVSSFDAGTIWAKLMSGYLHCSSAVNGASDD